VDIRRATVGPNGSHNSEIRAIPATTNNGVKQDAKNHSIFVVRSPCRRGSEVLYGHFQRFEVGRILRYGEEAAKISKSGRPVGSVLTIEFEIEGERFVALNGGPGFKFNESISFVVNCETQEEVDYFWEKFIADGGHESQCGWLKDKFGVSWQVVPTVLIDMLHDKDSEKSERVMARMLQMTKINIKELKAAYAGK
jgi:predicted 3-demethylubiquinone-9 3-methyltransferase (glyoxalase superfamily)